MPNGSPRENESPFEFPQPWEPMALEADPDICSVMTQRSYVRSTASIELLREMRRYARRRTTLGTGVENISLPRPRMFGRSVLVSGVRGSGKTHTVYWVIRETQKALLDAGYPMRLLPVLISAPTFMGDSAKDSEKSPAAQTDLVQTAVVEADRSVIAPSSKAEPKESDHPRFRMLIELCINLHRAVIREFLRSMRERLRERESQTKQTYRILDNYELLAQFTQDIQDHLPPSELRAYWRRFEFLRPDRRGTALFSMSAQLPMYQGIEEINLLKSLNDIYLRAIGSVERWSKQSDDASTAISSESRDKAAKPLTELDTWKPLLTGLLGGSIAGTGALATSFVDTIPAIFLALLGAVGFGWLTTLYPSWKRSRSVTRGEEYKRDYSRETLHHEIPRLVDSLFQVGLCPIFIIDELDKVRNLDGEFDLLLLKLKQFFQEDGFFCFLTNRQFFDKISVHAQLAPFNSKSTFFTNRLFMEVEPWNLREFVRDRFRIPGEVAESH